MFQISRYMMDHQSSHNTPLPEREFEEAVSIFPTTGGHKLGSSLPARPGSDTNAA